MEKVIAYSVSERRDMKNFETGNKLYFAQAQSRGEMGLEEISDRIQRECTVTRADISAVLIALSTVVTDGLKSGEVVRLGNLGSMQIGISSTGAKEKDQFTSANITKARIKFRPGKDLIGALTDLSYRQVEPKSKKTTQAAD